MFGVSFELVVVEGITEWVRVSGRGCGLVVLVASSCLLLLLRWAIVSTTSRSLASHGCTLLNASFKDANS